MTMEYLKPVKCDCLYSDTQEVTTIDTHGLVAQIKTSADIMISVDGEFMGGYCYFITPDETFRFSGSVKIQAKSGSAYIYVMYFDAV